MTGWLRSGLLMILLSASWTICLAEEQRVSLLHEDSQVAREAAQLLSVELQRMGWSAAEIAIRPDQSAPLSVGGGRALVAFGTRAFVAALRSAGGRPVVAALIPLSSLDDIVVSAGDRWSVIQLDQPVDRWISLIQVAFPKVQRVGMLVGPGTQRSARAMDRRMGDRRLILATEPVNSPDDIVPAIDRLLPWMEVLLAIPDATVHNRNTVQPLLLTTYRAGIPVLAYSEAYQQAGAALALYSTIPQIVTQVRESLVLVSEGRSLPNIQTPRYFTVAVNNAVTRSLGLTLPPASELMQRLRSSGQ